MTQGAGTWAWKSSKPGNTKTIGKMHAAKHPIQNLESQFGMFFPTYQRFRGIAHPKNQLLTSWHFKPECLSFFLYGMQKKRFMKNVSFLSI